VNSRLSQILIVLGALLAFVPVLAVDYLLDTYVRDRESQNLFADLESLTSEAQDAVSFANDLFEKALGGMQHEVFPLRSKHAGKCTTGTGNTSLLS